MDSSHKDRVEQLEDLFGTTSRSFGVTNRTLGRRRIKVICRVGDSAMSMWKKNGIPPGNAARLLAAAIKYDLPIPEWMLAFEGPETLNDLVPERASS